MAIINFNTMQIIKLKSKVFLVQMKVRLGGANTTFINGVLFRIN